ncbi:MAG: PAS domain S-box protein, partial [Ruminococcus sp.]|nr:PAS domain S-box protein [Ruminococcus sp.]
MYSCHLNISLVGEPCGLFNIIKRMPPMEHFFHEFSETSDFLDSSISRADVIFCNYTPSCEAVDILVSRKKPDAQLIIIAESSISSLSDFFQEFTDIWIAPMSDKEAEFRFKRWQQSYQMSKELWQTNQFLESTINSIPNLVWYKDKNGIHEKVNDSFCNTVNKTKEQVEGRDHFYIWDVDPDDPASNGHDCMESDLEVIRSEKTCVAEETVMSGNEIKLLTTYKSPLYDIDGSVMGTVGIGIDITQERAYQQEIVNNNHVLEDIFAAVDCGIICHSIDGSRIIKANQTALKILGYNSHKELADNFKIIAQSVYDDDKPALINAIKKLKNEGDSVSVAYKVEHSDGKIIHVMGNIKLLKENDELFYQRFLLDCTAQKKQEEENKRRQMELIQALSTDYSCILLLDLDLNLCTSIRTEEKRGSIFAALSADNPFEENIAGYIQSFV